MTRNELEFWVQWVQNHRHVDRLVPDLLRNNEAEKVLQVDRTGSEVVL